MSDAETKALAEKAGEPWFKLVYVERIEKGRAKGRRLEISGAISRDVAEELFALLEEGAD